MNILKEILNIADPILSRKEQGEDNDTALKKYRTNEEKEKLELLFDKLSLGGQNK